MGITERVKKRAMGLSQQALEKLLADERRAQKFAEALGALQRGKEKFDSTQRNLMHQFNFATKSDVKELGRHLSSLKKRLKSLQEKLSKM